MRLFAQFVSFLFNPLLLTLGLSYFVVFRQTYDILYALKWQLFTLVFVIAAALLFVLGKWRGIFSDYDVSKREERPKMFFILLTISVAYLLAASFFKGVFFPISLIAFGVCVAVVAFMIVNYRIKASGHVAVACAFVITITVLFGLSALLATLWIVPLITWSRVFLRRHTAHEVITGGLLGSVITLITLFSAVYLFTMPVVPVYLVFLTVFFLLPIAFLWLLCWRVFTRYKKTFIFTIIPTFLFGVPWDTLSVVTGLWRYDRAPTLGIWFGVLPLEEYFFTLTFPIFVVSVAILIRHYWRG